MANSPEDSRGPEEEPASLPKTLERQIMIAVARKMALADVEDAGVYDWAAFESTTAAEFKTNFPGNDTRIDEMTARVITIHIAASRNDY